MRWLASSALVVFAVACDSGAASLTDGGERNGADSVFADADPFVDPFGDAALAVRARAQLGHCAGGPETACHGANAAGMHLPDDPSATSLINVPSRERPDLVRVKPGEPERSYLYLKVRGDGGMDGAVMPPSIDRDPRIQALLHEWIEAGAP